MKYIMFMMLYLGSIQIDGVISESRGQFCKGIIRKRILQMSYMKMTISLSFSCNSFEKFP